MNLTHEVRTRLKLSLGGLPYYNVHLFSRRLRRRVKDIATELFPASADVPYILLISSSTRASSYRTILGQGAIVHDTSYVAFLVEALSCCMLPPIHSFVLFNQWAAETFLNYNRRKLALELTEVTHAKLYHYGRKLEERPDDTPFYDPYESMLFRAFHPEEYSAPLDAFVLGHEVGHAAITKGVSPLGIDLPYAAIVRELRSFAKGNDIEISYPLTSPKTPKVGYYPEISYLSDNDSAFRTLFNEVEVQCDFFGFLISARESLARDCTLQSFCWFFQQFYYLLQILSTLETYVGSIHLSLDSPSSLPTAKVRYPIYGLRYLAICQCVGIALRDNALKLQRFFGCDVSPLDIFGKSLLFETASGTSQDSWGSIINIWRYARWSFKSKFDPWSPVWADPTMLELLLPNNFRPFVLSDDWLMMYYKEEPSLNDPDSVLVGMLHSLMWIKWVVTEPESVAAKNKGCYRRAAESLSNGEVLKLLRRPLKDDNMDSYPF